MQNIFNPVKFMSNVFVVFFLSMKSFADKSIFMEFLIKRHVNMSVLMTSAAMML